MRRYVVPALAVAALTAMSLPATPGSSPAVESPDRPADQTFLTYPEWFLVWSPREYADYLAAARSPSRFPFGGHLGQFWASYRAVWDLLRDDYPFNAGYHGMVMVIGISTTVEYGIKGTYEFLVGRPAEALGRAGGSAEDRFAADAAQRYVDFIYETPFYRFEFLGVVADLWIETPVTWSDPVRALERRWVLTTEYVLKGAYGWAIRQSAEASYATPLLTTTVLADRLPSEVVAHYPDIEPLEHRDGGDVLLNLPRYQRFTDHVGGLAEAGVSFREIAGNDGLILVTVLASPDWTPPADAPYDVLFEQPLLTQHHRRRVAVVCPVPQLAATLRQLTPEVELIEHVYDY